MGGLTRNNQSIVNQIISIVSLPPECQTKKIEELIKSEIQEAYKFGTKKGFRTDSFLRLKKLPVTIEEYLKLKGL